MAQNVLNRETHNGVQGDTFTPRVDIFEAEKELVVYADLPGVKPEDLDLQFEKGELILRATCPPRRAGGFVRQEYGVGDFYRAFTVAEEIDADKIAAELKNGVLTVRLPKAEKAQPRKIQVGG